MSFLTSLLYNREKPIHSYADFWDWFQKHEQKFYKVLKEKGDINNVFFQKLVPKLNELKDGFVFLAGMYGKDTAQLVLTVDGIVKNIAFVEDLVAEAPVMENWKITALKQPSDLNYYSIQMNGYTFDRNKMCFYSTEHKSMPDEIDITITHQDLNEENKSIMMHGVYLTLDNFLGELKSVTTIDNIDIINPKDAMQELIPLQKLKPFLVWREKEFVEKYKGTRRNTKKDNYSALEGTLKNGLPLFALINTNLLHWDSKASHPWITIIEMKYEGNANGMPDTSTYKILTEIEEEITAELKGLEGYLNVGRQTANSARSIYFACVDFRKPSKVLYKIKKQYQELITLDFDIYKDKYWQSFKQFITD